MRTIKPIEVTHFYVLLALADGPLHGYGIHRKVQEDSRSTVYFNFAALYALLHKLEQRGFVEPVSGGPSQGPARTTYALTLAGKRMLKATGGQLRDAGELARRRIA